MSKQIFTYNSKGIISSSIIILSILLFNFKVIRNNFNVKLKTYAWDTGSFVDTRDNQSYKWIKIKNKIWMCENLRYIPDYGYYRKKYSIFKKYRKAIYYTYSAAQKVVPKGWHLPSTAEFRELMKNIDSLFKENDRYEIMKLIKENIVPINYNYHVGIYYTDAKRVIHSPMYSYTSYWTRDKCLGCGMHKNLNFYDYYSFSTRDLDYYGSTTSDSLQGFQVRCVKD